MANRSIRQRIYSYQIPVEPGTPFDAPQVDDLAVPDTMLRRVELIIPGGHVFITGFSLWQQGQQLVPWPVGTLYIVDDNAKLSYDMGFEVDGMLQAVTYNDDIFQHNFWVRLILDDLILPGEQGARNQTNAVAL